MDANEQRLWDRIGVALQSERRRITQAIASYPTPIAGCDQQFNHLLEQRAALQSEWARFEAVQQDHEAVTGRKPQASQFLAECAALDPAVKERILRPVPAVDAG